MSGRNAGGMLRDVPIRYLLLASFLVSGIIPLMVVAVLSLDAAHDELFAQAERQLESVRDLKGSELRHFFLGAARQIEVLAADPTTQDALRELRALEAASGGPDALGLRARARGDFDAIPAYRALHARLLPFFRRYMEAHELYDLFLIDPEDGFTLFTVVKEEDFGVRIRGTDSGLADAFAKAADARQTAVSDTRPYGPSGDAPAQFVAAPVVVNGELLGVVAVQISIDAIDRIMGASSGIGATGDAYVVGEDLRLRSDTSHDPRGHSVVASFRGSVADNGVDTTATRAALAGQVGVRSLTSFDGRTVLGAYAPVEFGGVRWAIVTEVDEAEISALIGDALDTEISVTIGISLLLLLLLTSGVSMVSSRGIARVVSALGTRIDEVLGGREHQRLDADELAVDFRDVAEKTNELAAALVEQTKENHHLEEVLRYNQRMESIGTLAGGIAHDFNNVLTYLGNYVELMVADLPEGSRARAYADEVDRGIDRATALVAQIMLFSRQLKEERRAVDVSLIVKEAVKLLKATLPPTIRVEKRVRADAGLYVLADPTQVHQVVMNLCTNAFHAMLRTGGVLRVTLERRDVGADEIPALEPGAYCALSVQDTGEGIDPAIVDRVFEPFFTTKPPGQGSGMGLAVVHGIVAAHGGRVDIVSALGEGTTMRVLLPLDESGVAAAEAQADPPPVRGDGRVLLVDDEAAICEAVGTSLRELGYRVTALTSPREALALVVADPGRFDVVVSDLSMPGLDGADLTREVKRLRPDLPIILATGYSERMTPQAAEELGAACLLMKPYKRYTLSVALRDALHTGEAVHAS
ncbi:MAG: hybrid sensor histidine kinase/response regulator [Deltaproteobacteria bacterium]|nr:MAG: hybrid sensor histidine kinase/response regulator [Deltaproteobacteria bacterium]